MASANISVRNPPPRMLNAKETLHSLDHWKTIFRTYYRRDSIFKAFLLPTAAWNPNAIDYGLLNEVVDDH